MSVADCMENFLGKVRCFCKQDSGMTLPLIAASFVTMIGLAGLSVDIARLQLVQSKLLFALDSAGLAAGATLNTANIDTELTKYLRANFPEGYLGATAPVATGVLSSDKKVLDVTGSTTVDPVFMQLFGIDTMTVSAKTQITRTSSGLELVMVLDNTGSMKGTPLTSLKNAANTLVNILYGDRETVKDLWVGLVPFSQAVNIGTSKTDWLDSAYSTLIADTSTVSRGWAPTSWYGCVDERTGGRDTTDDPPSVEKFKQYYYPGHVSTSSNYWKTASYKYGWNYVNPFYYYSSIGVLDTTRGPNLYCPQPVTPMNSSKSTILGAINSMYASGGTHINLGLVWGWRMLSPRWRGTWGGEMDEDLLPLNYNTEHMNKAIVLLTDGNNTAYEDNSDRTAYGYLSENRLGTTDVNVAKTELNNRLLSVCTALKNNGVYIYTISLGTEANATTKALLKSCATADSYFFDSPSNSALQAVFSAIGDSLSNLRVSK